jgi:Protein of unknown function (DUF3592)
LGKTGRIVGGVFLPIGLVFLAVALYFFKADQTLAESGARAEGTVIEVVRARDTGGKIMYRPLVEFRTPGGERQEFASDVSASTPGYGRGERVQVLFDPDNPADAKIDSFMERFFIPLIFSLLGSIFTIVGGGILFTVWRRRGIIESLRQSGRRIEAEVIGCERDTGLKINGRHPFRVHAQATHPATGKLASFASEPIWVDLSAILANKSVPVLIDPAKPGRHYVDLSEWVDGREEG